MRLDRVTGGAAGGGSGNLVAPATKDIHPMATVNQPRVNDRREQQRNDSAAEPHSLTETSPDGSQPSVRAGTKQAKLVSLLSIEAGSTCTELADQLGWLPHTTRAALTGLRKRGFAVTTDRGEDATRYRIVIGGNVR